MPTTLGSVLFKDYQPGRDAFVTRKLKEAGGIILGKATLGELGGGDTHGSLFGSTRNPYALDRDLVVWIWNRRAEDLWGLRAEEVRGESLLALDIGLPVGELRRPIQAALAALSADDELTLEAVDRQDRRFRCRVSISPLAAGDTVHGAVLLMENAAE